MLWGEFAAVPQSNVVSLVGGERVEAGGRVFDVAYTPGHASHHVSYFDPSAGVAFVGDVAGVCVREGYVLPPTPPPDIDVEVWITSVDRILAWSPSTLFLTHFGPITRVRPHLAELLDHLHVIAGAVRESLETEGTDEEKSERFCRLAASGTAPPHERRRSGLVRGRGWIQIPLVWLGAILEEAPRCSVAAGLKTRRRPINSPAPAPHGLGRP